MPNYHKDVQETLVEEDTTFDLLETEYLAILLQLLRETPTVSYGTCNIYEGISNDVPPQNTYSTKNPCGNYGVEKDSRRSILEPYVNKIKRLYSSNPTAK